MFFSMLSAFGALFARRVRILRGAEHPIDTTQNIILVAPSGEGKGTSINRAAGTLEKAAPGFEIVGGLATMQGILARLQPERARGLIIAEELGALFGKQNYQASLDLQMTDLLDNKDTFRWHTKGTTGDQHEGTFRSVGVTFLAGTTLPWMQRCMPGTALEEGFASRVLWVLCVEPPRFIPHLPRRVPGYKELVGRLRALHLKLGTKEILLSTEEDPVVSRWWRTWNEKHEEDLPLGDPWTRGWWNRKPSVLLQLGLVLSIAYCEKVGAEIKLQPVALVGAEKILGWAEPGMLRLLSLLGSGEPYGLQRKLLSVLASMNGQGTVRELHRRVAHITGYKQVTENTLKELQSLEAITGGVVQNQKGKKCFGWSITEKGYDMLE